MNILCKMTIAKMTIMRYNHSMLPNGTKIFLLKEKSIMKKILAIALAVLMLAGCCAVFASCSKDSDTIKIGLSGPLTGPASVYGEAVANAAQMAVDEINAAGGLNGVMFELKAMDDEHDPTKIANNYAALSDLSSQSFPRMTTYSSLLPPLLLTQFALRQTATRCASLTLSRVRQLLST